MLTDFESYSLVLSVVIRVGFRKYMERLQVGSNAAERDVIRLSSFCFLKAPC